jgi:hypothetical protein
MDDQFRIEMIETYPLFWGTLILCNLWKPQNAGVLNNEMRMFLMLVMVLQSTKVVVEAKKVGTKLEQRSCFNHRHSHLCTENVVGSAIFTSENEGSLLVF